MKRFTTIVCSFAFLLSGIFMAIGTKNGTVTTRADTGYKTLAAATPLNFGNIQNNSSKLPLDLSLDLLKQKGVKETTGVTTASLDSQVIDSLKKKITQLEKTQVTKVTNRGSAPKVIVKTKVIEKIDTVKVPVYYLATQTGVKERPDNCTSIYEVKKVDEICTNSSVENVNEHIHDVNE